MSFTFSRFSPELNYENNYIELIQPCLSPNTTWTRDILHDSESEIGKIKMNDYFSSLICDNSADAFGLNYVWDKSNERRNAEDIDRINVVKKEMLTAPDSNEAIHERNLEMEKLISKFDANIEDIWKSNSELEKEPSAKSGNFYSQNFLINPCPQYGSNFIWSFEKNESLEKIEEFGATSKFKIPFTQCNKYSSPILGNSYDLDTMLNNAFNATLTNLQKWSAVDGNNCSTNILNHNNVESCFGEVVPKVVDEEFNQNFECNIFGGSYQEEEDLLTSAKTHFRPIRAEELCGSQNGNYADGTTFAISHDLEKVSFKRSESGLLYLEEDSGTSKKYMEFIEKEGGYSKSDWNNRMEEFVPKFRVRQSNEKSIQTDDVCDEQVVPSVIETDCESVSCDSEEDEFYFPGDEELALNIVNAIEEEHTPVSQTSNFDYTFDSKMDTQEMSSFKMPEDLKACICCEGQNWNLNSNTKQQWSEIWNSKATCGTCQNNFEKLSVKDKFMFREELTREGEQLLLDLRCLQQMYSNSDWYDEDCTIASDSNDEETLNSAEEINSEDYSIPDFGRPGKGSWWTSLVAKDEPIRNGFDFRGLWNEAKISSDDYIRHKNRLNERKERPLIASTLTERKR